MAPITVAIVFVTFVAASYLAYVVIGGLMARYDETHVTQYLFFIRYPITAGALLVALPLFGPWLAPGSLTNVFVVGWIGAAIVSLFASLLIWSLVYVARLTWVSVPWRCELAYRRDSNWEDEAKNRETALQGGDLMFWRWSAASLALGLPLAFQIVKLADGPRLWNLMAVVGGVAVAWGLREISVRRTAKKRLAGAAAAGHHAKRRHLKLPEPLGKVYHEMGPNLKAVHFRAFRYFVVSLIVYLALGVVANPYFSLPAGVIPALSVVLAEIMVLLWILGGVAFIFDRGRIPVVAVIATALLVVQFVMPTDHEFEVQKWDAGPAPRSDQVLEQWCKKHPSSRPLVVVAASGGGIRASLWAAQVLAGLEKDVVDFHDRVALLSCVSGGAVSSAYYVDRFTNPDATTPEALEKLIEDAGASSLTAAVWGLAYPDLWHVLAPRVLNRYDRGWALEQAWGKRMSGPRPPTLQSWLPATSAGLRPLVIFNATLQETGERLLLSPARLPLGHPPGGVDRQDLSTFLPGGDLEVLTAARLSASFPYISPQSRPPLHQSSAKGARHVGDGAYYDNSGLLSCVDVLGSFYENANPSARPRKLALIEIRASGVARAVPKVDADKGGAWSGIFGPLLTMFHVQSKSQVVRTNWELDMVMEKWNSAHQVECKHFVFHLSEQLPLSWHLTENEKKDIRSHWPTAKAKPRNKPAQDSRDDNAEELANLKVFLSGKEGVKH